MANYDDVLNYLRYASDGDLYDIFREYQYTTDFIHGSILDISELDDELNYIRTNCISGVNSRYYELHKIINHSIELNGFNPYDNYFSVDFENNYLLKSYHHVIDYLESTGLLDELTQYIIDTNDCLGDVDLNILLDDEEEEC